MDTLCNGVCMHMCMCVWICACASCVCMCDVCVYVCVLCTLELPSLLSFSSVMGTPTVSSLEGMGYIRRLFPLSSITHQVDGCPLSLPSLPLPSPPSLPLPPCPLSLPSLPSLPPPSPHTLTVASSAGG